MVDEIDDPPSVNNGLKWHKMVQLWNQLIIKDGALYRFIVYYFRRPGSGGITQFVIPDTLKELSNAWSNCL